MGIKKLLKDLQKGLSKAEASDAVRLERLDDLLGKLETKEKKLANKLAKEKDSSKRKAMKMELKILSTQRKKGARRRKELEKKRA